MHFALILHCTLSNLFKEKKSDEYKLYDSITLKSFEKNFKQEKDICCIKKSLSHQYKPTKSRNFYQYQVQKNKLQSNFYK